MNQKILLVDDDANILSAYQRNLRRNFQVVTATSGREGLEVISEEGPFAVIVSDYRMPEMDGVQFLTHAQQAAPDTVRIMLTGQADMNVSIQAVNEGRIFRFLTKPCPIEDFSRVLTLAVEQYALVTTERELLEKTLKGSIRLLIDVLSAASPIAFSRASRLHLLSRRVANRMKAENTWEIEIAAMLSQIGCVTVPAEILTKAYAGNPLNENENEIFKAHPQAGRNLLTNIPRLEAIGEGIAFQMKQYDGGGLPADPRKGKQIPLTGRILKVIQDFDWELSLGKTPSEAMDVLRTHLEWYDPDIFAALEAELLSIHEGYVVRALPFQEVVTGMVLADDLVDMNGAMLIPKGYEISEALKMRLSIFARLGHLREPVKVLESISKIQS